MKLQHKLFFMLSDNNEHKVNRTSTSPESRKHQTEKRFTKMYAYGTMTGLPPKIDTTTIQIAYIQIVLQLYFYEMLKWKGLTHWFDRLLSISVQFNSPCHQVFTYVAKALLQLICFYSLFAFLIDML